MLAQGSWDERRLQDFTTIIMRSRGARGILGTIKLDRTIHQPPGNTSIKSNG